MFKTSHCLLTLLGSTEISSYNAANHLYSWLVEFLQFSPLQIIAYLTSAKRLSENELYELSCQTEPTNKS